MPASWDIDPLGLAVFVEEDVKKLTYETSYKVWDKLMQLSPILTGQFRASWNMTVNAPKFDTVDTGGSPEAPLPPPKRPVLRTSEKAPMVFIVNAKPYAERLEYGWSQQAPYGIVRQAVEVA